MSSKMQPEDWEVIVSAGIDAVTSEIESLPTPVASALCNQGLPAEVRDQVKEALNSAISTCFKRGRQDSTPITVCLLRRRDWMNVEVGAMELSALAIDNQPVHPVVWSFFIVERLAFDRPGRLIELYLYLEK